MRKGRELEIVVEALERCFAPAEAEIKSPDSIPDRITGAPREVDVSIRYKLGSVPVLVILECRDRGSVQDVTWIEQLAKKRDDVRASRAVAVSSKGFSETAKVKAAHDAIELRTISELDRAVVLAWCVASQTIGYTRRTNLTHVGFGLVSSADANDTAIRAVLSREDGTIDVTARVFRSTKTGQVVPLSNIWWAAVDQHNLFATVPPDGTRVTKKLHLIFETDDRWELLAGEKQYEVEAIALTGEMWVDQTQHPISRVLEYSGPAGTNIQAVEFEMPVEGKSFVLSLYSDTESGRGGVSFRRRDGSKGDPETGV